MKRKGKAGIALITAGSLLLAAALLLVGYNLADEYRAGKAAEHVLEVLQQQMRHWHGLEVVLSQLVEQVLQEEISY